MALALNAGPVRLRHSRPGRASSKSDPMNFTIGPANKAMSPQFGKGTMCSLAR
jgi:hypothetical protein